MLNTLVKLTHYSEKTRLTGKSELINFFKLLRFFSQEALNATMAFSKQHSYSQFDPHVGEAMCQLRAYKIYALVFSLLRGDKKYFSNQQESIKKFIVDIDKQLINVGESVEKIYCQSIDSTIKNSSLHLPINDDLIFLIRCYFLNRFKENLGDNITAIDIERLCQELNCSRKMAKKIIHHNQVSLADDSCNLVFDLYSQSERYQYITEFLSILRKHDDDNRKVFPCFLATYILTKKITQDEITVIFNCHRTYSRGKEKLSFVFTSSKNRELFRTNNLNHIDFVAPCIIINGVADCRNSPWIDNKHDYIKHFKYFGLTQVINLNMAAHPQYPGDKLNSLNENIYSNLKAASKEFNYFYTMYYNYKKNALLQGFCQENKSLFFIEHIYCDSLLNHFLNEEKEFIFYDHDTKKDIAMSNNETTQNSIEVKDFYENLIALLPGHIFWKDRACKLLGCNDQQAIDFGYKTRFELLGKSNYELTWHEQPEEERKKQAEALNKVDLEVMKTGEPHTVEEPLVLPDGSTAVYLSKKVPLRNKENQIIGLLGIGIDITDIRAYENELRSAKDKIETLNKAKSELLAIVTQKVTDPLNVIVGSLSLIDKLDSIDEIKLYLNNCKKAADKIRPMLQSINDYLQLENGDLKILPHDCDIHNILNTIIQDNQSNCAERNNTINLEINDLPAKIIIDGYWLMNILETIINNANRFTQSGKVIVKVSVSEDQNLLFSIKDTGLGFSEEKLSSVFNLYPSGQGNINLKNFGIRLSVTKKLIELMGGKIHISSKLNEGSEVQFCLPYVLNKKGTHQNFKAKAKILLIEDDLLSKQVEQKILEFMDFIVDTATTGKEALSYDIDSYDLVCVDINLPDISGVDLCRAMKRKVKKKMPVFIAITAFSADNDISEYFEAGFSELIEKPISLERMKNKVLPLLELQEE